MEEEASFDQEQQKQQSDHQNESLQIDLRLLQETSSVSEKSDRERQLWRKQQIADVCKSLGASGRLLTKNTTLSPEQFHNFLVDDSRHIVYCEVPKVASSNWKRVLVVLTGIVNTTTDLGYKDIRYYFSKQNVTRLSTYQLPEIEHRLNTYYKFMFVREPFERLLSAYRNKFMEKHSRLFHQIYGRHIVQRYRKKPTNISLILGNDVTFREFVSYLLDPKTTEAEPFNPHWRPVYEICHPCFVNYDVVGKFETMNEDADFILDQLGVKDIVSFPNGYRRLRTSKRVASYFANISAADVDGLWKMYSKDFLLFDYSYTDFGMNLSSTINYQKQSRV